MSLNKQVFVAYAYGIYDKRDYRDVFNKLENSYDIKFIFADEKITNMHIMQKIISYIKASDFSIFDISGWNPNVTLELGFAMATSNNWYICFNPEKTPQNEVPSDIKGIDRLQYKSFTELHESLSKIIEQTYPKKGRIPGSDYIERLQDEVVTILRSQPGLRMDDIARVLQISVPLAQAVISPMLDKTVKVEGMRRGAKYYLISER